ncbi:uncharacterized protein K460DRAFT_355389 [Cucurbitaria berberidis CBS 394.84]|uniref:Uncharacterized protein n=1 Tax=Cucurbitaria berberidis CBS 394.84 TaxID=1168544 RepID=A0A9P4L822_9PLEO|nr:uncharacterized protein K460DRAFT_355389 [Cucurbitaria berberidis CBS 394.84]KAF1845586.1 hypothetical protein K460DRAFT_355389 [Cucurbitaria berberidis CBS 394.84]
MHWRHIKLRNPLRPRSQTLLETILAKEAEKKKTAKQEQKKLEKDRDISLARLERREAIWPRLKRFLRRMAPADFWEKLPAGMVEGMTEQEAAVVTAEEGEDEVVLEGREGTDDEEEEDDEI